jgi:hypothetical protein
MDSPPSPPLTIRACDFIIKVIIDSGAYMNLGWIYIITLGVAFLLLFKQLSSWSVKLYDNISVPHVDEETYRIFYLVGGLLFTVIGLLELFNK